MYLLRIRRWGQVIHTNGVSYEFHMLKPKSPEDASLEFLLTHSVSNGVNDYCAVFRQVSV